LIIIRA
jgi:hypothetical protein